MIGGRNRNIAQAAGIGDRDTIKTIDIIIELVVARFEMDILENKKAGRHPDGESKNVDQ